MTWNAAIIGLTSYSVKDRREHLPEHLQKLVERACATMRVRKVWLFGSRAKGGARPNSDFDLAFEIELDSSAWAAFSTSIQDDPPALYRYDLVLLNRAEPSLREAVLKEGIVIYESGC